MLRYTFSSEESFVFRKHSLLGVQIGVWHFMGLSMELVLHLTQFNAIIPQSFQNVQWISASLVNCIALAHGVAFLAVFPIVVYGFLSALCGHTIPFIVLSAIDLLISCAGIAVNVPDLDVGQSSWYHMAYYTTTLIVHLFAFVISVKFVMFARALNDWILNDRDMAELASRFEQHRKKLFGPVFKGRTR
ncbi:hypothetical protein AAVH_00088 [Aphelenchoides avenae]|nr:hypothetical protein AAVH_00088 [Aphelenchus avenae]